MSMKIKNFCFVGIAAAMLSATAANAAKTARTPAASTAGVVTSQKYTETTYEYVADKVDNYASMDATARTTANTDDKYPSMLTMTTYAQPKIGGTADQLAVTTATPGNVTYDTIVKDSVANAQNAGWNNQGDGTNGTYLLSDTNIPTEKAIVNYVDTELTALATAVGGDTAKQPAVDGKIMVGTLSGTNSDEPDWTGMNNAVKEKSNGYIDITDEAGNTGAIELDIDANKIQSANTAASNVNTSGSEAKLATAGVVQRKQTDANKYQVSSNAEWTDLSNAVSGGTYVSAAATATGGAALDVSASTDAAGIAAATTPSTTLVTDYAVKDYAVKIAQGAGAANKTLVTDASGNVTVSSVTSSPLPAQPDTCTDANPCALVADATGGIHWVAMAQPQ